MNIGVEDTTTEQRQRIANIADSMPGQRLMNIDNQLSTMSGCLGRDKP